MREAWSFGATERAPKNKATIFRSLKRRFASEHSRDEEDDFKKIQEPGSSFIFLEVSLEFPRYPLRATCLSPFLQSDSSSSIKTLR